MPPKNELPHKNQPYTKNNSKLIMDLNVRAKIIEHLKESTEKLHDLELG